MIRTDSDGARVRGIRAIRSIVMRGATVLGAVMSCVTFAHAQRGDQRVALEVRPRPGDTLRVTLEQSFSVSGGPKGVPASAITFTTSYHVQTRDIVQRADPRATVILAIVESVHTSTS